MDHQAGRSVMTIQPHKVIEYVTTRVKDLKNPTYRDMVRHAGCFSADRGGKRVSISVFLDMLPPLIWYGIFRPAEWAEPAIADFVVKSLEGKQ
jgi:hypothetical protein